HRSAWISRLYCFDLLGAAAGCLFLTFLLNRLGGPTAVFMVGIVTQAAALCFGWRYAAPPEESTRRIRRVIRSAWTVIVLSSVGRAGTRAFRPVALRIGERWFDAAVQGFGLPNSFQWYVDHYVGKELDTLTRFGYWVFGSGIVLAAAMILLLRRSG